MYKIINRTLIFILITLIILMINKNLFKPMNNMGAATTIIQDSQEPELSKEQVEVMINNYLMDNPEIIIASIEKFQKSKTNELKAKVNLTANKDIIKKSNLDDYPFIGNPDGIIVIEELYDYNCGYCKKGGKILDQIAKKNNDIKIIFRPLPILGENSLLLAKVILEVYKSHPAKFVEIHDKFLVSESMSEEDIKNLLTAHGIDYNVVIDNFEKNELKVLINNTLQLAQTLNIRGVPAYIINGVLTTGGSNIEDFEKIINNVRSKKSDN